MGVRFVRCVSVVLCGGLKVPVVARVRRAGGYAYEAIEAHRIKSFGVQAILHAPYSVTVLIDWDRNGAWRL